ncbi:domain of unknown function DUF1745 [Gloeothece citriformis PCC 7424]|uniref:FIST C domain protein n=2 Tax=Gloeothece TaxID=28070 RepID=B7KL79_GLOC7|nr:domain of unknown function DUF1745 [Gloeothece citriformis PCC 7424]
MQWTNALSTRPSLEAAVTEVVDKITSSLTDSPDLGIVFISSAYASDYPRLVPLILEKLPLPILIGCGGGGIIGMKGSDQVLEIEGSPALSLSVATMPGVEITPFYLSADELPDLDAPPEAWSNLIGVLPDKNPQFILLCDPFTSKINDLLEGLDFAYPGAVKIGGLASTSTMGLPSALFYHHSNQVEAALYREGTIGIAFAGEIIVETIVAQGCRPIGEPYRINHSERNIIIELTDIDNETPPRPPLVILQDLVQSLSDQDRQLAQHSLFIGIARDEFKFQLHQGDFLIRNLIGVDPRQGAIAVGDRVRNGQRIQFHLRDAQTSATDLELLLQAYQREPGRDLPAAGALMFSCLGRGEGLYGELNFDSNLFRHYLQNICIGGFFCNGEIGPVGGRTFLHGYTSAFAIFRQP